VVSVSSLWADEDVSYPVDVEPSTPAHHFAMGKADPAFRTKLQLAVELARRAKEADLPFRAVVADACSGKEYVVQYGLAELGLGYVLALPPSHGWWQREGQIGGVRQAAEAAGWQDTEHPGQWMKRERHFRDGHAEVWWALAVEVGPYRPSKAQRVVVATTDPTTLPERTAWYLVTNLPKPGTERATASAQPAVDLAEVVRLFGLRNWVEQSYKQVTYALGWGEYQVRSDRAIRRHWALVWCAFSFCWLHQQEPGGGSCVVAGPGAASRGTGRARDLRGHGPEKTSAPPHPARRPDPASRGQWPCVWCAPGWNPGSCSGATGGRGHHCPRHRHSKCCLTPCGRAAA